MQHANPHGGRRIGAGRPNRSGLRGHVRRERIHARRPLHVVLRLQKGLPSFRRKEIFRHLRAAVKKSRAKGLAVSHFSILSNHIHFIVESNDHQQLAKAMQSLAMSFSKRLNSLMKRTGAVFRDRYYSRVIRGVREMRNVLRYVIANQALHEQKDRGRRGPLEIQINPFSSALAFDGWHHLNESPDFDFSRWDEVFIEAWHFEILVRPQTWLLREGWKINR